MPIFKFKIRTDGPAFWADTVTAHDNMYDAGCSDATLRPEGEFLCLDFEREAESAIEATVLAIEQVDALGFMVTGLTMVTK